MEGLYTLIFERLGRGGDGRSGDEKWSLV